MSGALRLAVPFFCLKWRGRNVWDLGELSDPSALRSVSARLAEFLVARADARGRATIALGMTQEQLAEELGTVREVIVRELKALRAAGLVRSLGPGRFEIVDAPALRARAGDDEVQKVKPQTRPSSLMVGEGAAPRKTLSRRLPGR